MGNTSSFLAGLVLFISPSLVACGSASPPAPVLAPVSSSATVEVAAPEPTEPVTASEELPSAGYEGREGDSIPAPHDVAAPPNNAIRTNSGLYSRVLRPGTGQVSPTSTSEVRVHYTGWTVGGEMFDSSVTRGESASFPLTNVIAGWTEGLQLMVEGEVRRFWIPADLAYGNGRPGAPSGMLVFDVELKTIIAAPIARPASPAPADVAAIPATAQTTPSGLASRVLAPGTGTQRPGPTDRVEVHYTGWTTDGAMFDSSLPRGRPATFGLNQVIPGWTEGLQLMVVGETRRLWIPENLAYGGRPGMPAGMLVFDVELISLP